MKETCNRFTGLNHQLAENDGNGTYRSVIASQANSSGNKRLELITIIVSNKVISYFEVSKNGSACGYISDDFIQAKELYNKTI